MALVVKEFGELHKVNSALSALSIDLESYLINKNIVEIYHDTSAIRELAVSEQKVLDDKIRFNSEFEKLDTQDMNKFVNNILVGTYENSRVDKNDIIAAQATGAAIDYVREEYEKVTGKDINDLKNEYSKDGGMTK